MPTPDEQVGFYACTHQSENTPCPICQGDGEHPVMPDDWQNGYLPPGCSLCTDCTYGRVEHIHHDNCLRSCATEGDKCPKCGGVGYLGGALTDGVSVG